MKRFLAAGAFAFALICLTAGCNDYGNTFQNNTGAQLTSISPSNASAGSAAMTITAGDEGRGHVIPEQRDVWDSRCVARAGSRNKIEITRTETFQRHTLQRYRIVGI